MQELQTGIGATLTDAELEAAKAAMAKTKAREIENGELEAAKEGKTSSLGKFTTDSIQYYARLSAGKRKAFLAGLELAASITVDTAMALSAKGDNAGASFCIQLAETHTKQATMMRRMKTGMHGDQEPGDMPQLVITRVVEEAAEPTGTSEPGGGGFVH